MTAHNNIEVSDPVENMLKKTGCINLHYQVQDCMAEKQDWRKCQKEVQDFRNCMEIYNAKRSKEIKS